MKTCVNFNIEVNSLKKVLRIAVVLVIAFLTGCNYTTPINEINDSKPKKEIYLDIMTTNKIVYNMVHDIVKEKHYVDYMFKNELDQWNFKYTTDSLCNISKQDLFFYVGAGFEPWANEFINNLKKDSVGVINISRGTTLLPYKKEIKYNNTPLKENPYYWINLDNYKVNMLNIKNAIEEKDPQNREYYEKNFSDALKQIDAQSKRLSEITQMSKDYIYLVQGEELDYFIKYNKLESLNLSEYDSLTNADQNQKEKFEKKLKDAKEIIFLYKSVEELKFNEVIINKYNMKVANILAYKDDSSYIEIIKMDVENLERVLK
jgi:zinc/manganese transport system substrate-binding protein